MTVGLTYGQFYTSLTRDDAGGLRYLLAAQNINFENGPAGSVLLNTSSGGGPGGLGPPFLLYTSNYTAFAAAALTNDPVTLATLFPGWWLSVPQALLLSLPHRTLLPTSPTTWFWATRPCWSSRRITSPTLWCQITQHFCQRHHHQRLPYQFTILLYQYQRPVGDGHGIARRRSWQPVCHQTSPPRPSP